MKINNHHIRQSIACMLCFTILLPLIGFAAPATARAEEATKKGAALLEEMCEQEQEENTIDEETLEIQQELNETYGEIKENMTLSETKDFDGIETVYEDEYAGSYIDDDKLVVCITEKQAAGDEICVSDENVEYRVVEHSYNELSDLQDKLSDTYSSLHDRYPEGCKEKDLLSSISGFGVDEELNAIVVEIMDLTEDKKEVFKELFGEHEEIILRNTESLPEEQHAYRPGKGIYVLLGRVNKTVDYEILSIGYRAYRKTKKGIKKGFVTAGHGCIDSIDNKIYISSKFDKSIGKIKKCQKAGSVDVSFVEIDKKHIVSRTCHYSNALGSTKNGDKMAENEYMTNVSKGSRVYKVGATTYRTAATVKNIKWSGIVNNCILKNLTSTSKFSDGGDSGGLVYTLYKNKYIPAGIITGGDKKISAYTKASEIVSALNVYPY